MDDCGKNTGRKNFKMLVKKEKVYDNRYRILICHDRSSVYAL